MHRPLCRLFCFLHFSSNRNLLTTTTVAVSVCPSVVLPVLRIYTVRTHACIHPYTLSFIHSFIAALPPFLSCHALAVPLVSLASVASVVHHRVVFFVYTIAPRACTRASPRTRHLVWTSSPRLPAPLHCREHVRCLEVGAGDHVHAHAVALVCRCSSSPRYPDVSSVRSSSAVYPRTSSGVCHYSRPASPL